MAADWPKSEEVELAGDAVVPGKPQRLYRKAAAGDIRDQVHDGVDMNQAGAVLVQPDRRRPVTIQQRGHAREMLDHLKALGVGPVQGESAV